MSQANGYVFMSANQATVPGAGTHLTMVVVFIRPRGLGPGVGLLGSGALASAFTYITFGLDFRGRGGRRRNRVGTPFSLISAFL